jgi:hypothetical protein
MSSARTIPGSVTSVFAVAAGLLFGSVPWLAGVCFWEISPEFREHLAFAALFFPIGLFYLACTLGLSIALFTLGFAGIHNAASRPR